MRRILTALSLAFVLTLASLDLSAARRAITVHSRADDVDSGFASTVVSPAQSHTAGRTLIAIVSYSEDGGNPSSATGATNTAGDTWSEGCTKFDLTIAKFQMFYTASTNGHASDVVTVSFSGAFGADLRMIAVFEVSGLDATPYEDCDSGSASPSGPVTTGSISVASTGLIIAFGRSADFGTTLTAGAGYTLSALTGFTHWATEYKAVSASEAASMGYAGADSADLVGYSFQEASGGAPSFVPAIIGNPRGGGVPQRGLGR
jgi:hypothetical protein